MGAAVAPVDQHRAEHDAEHREAGTGEEGGLEALGESFRQRRGATPLRQQSSVRELATVASTASPSAPPICCDVLIRPLARPASRSSTPATAAIVTGTNENPSPTAARRDGPSTSLT